MKEKYVIFINVNNIDLPTVIEAYSEEELNDKKTDIEAILEDLKQLNIIQSYNVIVKKVMKR